MALSAFDDKAHPPTQDEISHVLGLTYELWLEIISHVTQTCAPLTELWTFSSAKFGWSLRLKKKDRVISYLTPQEGQFLAGIVLGEKAARAAHENGLPVAVLNLIDNAPKYAEGRGIRLTVHVREDINAVKELVKVKLSGR